MKVFNTDERVKRIADRMANDSSAVDLVRKYIEMRDSIPMVDVSPSANIAVSPERSVEVTEPMVSAPEQTGLAGYVPGDEEYVPFVPAFVPEGADLFSDEAKARRRLKQMYVESGFRKNAVSKAGARGLFQIMPITEKDYITRGKGKSGDIFDEAYNERIRDYVFSVIPKDLGKYWSDDDSDENKLAKLYAAYNWGVGNLRSYLRKKSESGVDISDPENWVGGLNPETRNYVTFLAMDKDVDGTALTNSAFEDAARKRGYMAEGGRLFDGGGEKLPLLERIAKRYLFGNLSDDEIRKRLYDNINPYEYGSVPRFVRRLKNAVKNGTEYQYESGELYSPNAARDDIFAEYLGIPQSERHAVAHKYLVGNSEYAPTIRRSGDKYYKIKNLGEYEKDSLIKQGLSIGHGNSSLSDALSPLFGTHTVSHGADPMRGDYVSYYDLWDINPFYGDRANEELYSIGFQYPKLIKNYPEDSWFDAIYNFDVKLGKGYGSIDINNPFYNKTSGNDVSLGLGTPLNFYDRIYLDDYYGVNSRPQNLDEFYGGYLLPVTVYGERPASTSDNDSNGFKGLKASGGRIHIKPEIFNGKVYYRDGGILEGDFDVDDISDEELYELDRLGYDVYIL